MNFDRFYNNLKEFAGIGEIEGQGINRLAFSKAYYKAIRLMEEYAKEKGLDVEIDKVGNMFISYNPNKSDKYLLIGSHMDTVKSAGLYDGALGVIGALEVVESLKEKNIDTPIGIVAVGFSVEEGSEMGGTFGSRVISGRTEYEDPLLEKNLQTYGLTIEDVRDSERDFDRVVGYVELHIEQGGVLDAKDLDIGVVNGIVGISRYNILIKGKANHAGTTPMDLRKDPNKDLAIVLPYLYKLAENYNPPFVMTVGNINVRPGMYNIIPSSTEVMIEVRDLDDGNIREFFEKLEDFLKENIMDYELIRIIDKAAVKLDSTYMDMTVENCIKRSYKYQVMSSGAGHDASEMSYVSPTAMIFVPSKDGISHSPDEYTSPDQLEKGLNILYDQVLSIMEGYKLKS